MNAPAAQPSRGRRIAVWLLVVLAAVITFASSLTMWVDRQMLDNTAWRNASEDVVRDPQVRSALSVYLVNQLYDNVDVAASLRNRLPSDAKPLAGPMAAALREPAVRGAEFMLGRPRIQDLFVEASGRAHQRLVNVLENKTGYGISTGSGVVTLDVGELVTELGTEMGVPQSALAKVPADTGQVVLMRSSQLSAAQQAVELVHALSLWLLVLVLVMFAAAVYLARGYRRIALRRVAWAFVIVGLLDLAVRRVAGNYVTDAISSPSYTGTAHRIWLIGTSILGQIGWAAVFYGAVALLGVILAGPTRPAYAVRRAIAPVLNERQGIAWGVVGFVFLLLVLWGGTHALRTWWGVLLLGGLAAAGMVALRRQTLAEAALAPAAVGPSLDVAALRAKLRRPERAAVPAEPEPGRSAAEEIARLRELLDAGSITEAEFEQGKRIALR